MSSDQRVFITGLSALSACGANADENWASIINGTSGIDTIKNWDLSTWQHNLGGELKNFVPSELLTDRKLIKLISRQDIMGIHSVV